MLKLIRNRATLVLAGLIAVLCPMLMAPTGGYPSRPTFQQVQFTQGAAFNPSIICNTGATATNQCWAWRFGGGNDLSLSAATDAGAPGDLAFDATRSGAAVTGVILGNTTDTPPITLSAAASSGSFGFGAINIGTSTTPVSTATSANQRAYSQVVDSTGGASNASQGFTTRNVSTSTSARNFGLEVGNDIVGHEATVGNTSTTFTGPSFSLVGGPSGETAEFAGFNQTCLAAGTAPIICENSSSNFVGTANTTTATGTPTGCTTAPTTTFRYTKIGNMVVGSVDLDECTSNSTTMTFTGAVPAAYQPARVQDTACNLIADNSVLGTGIIEFNTATSTVSIFKAVGVFTASGQKGIGGGCTFAYITN